MSAWKGWKLWKWPELDAPPGYTAVRIFLCYVVSLKKPLPIRIFFLPLLSSRASTYSYTVLCNREQTTAASAASSSRFPRVRRKKKKKIQDYSGLKTRRENEVKKKKKKQKRAPRVGKKKRKENRKRAEGEQTTNGSLPLKKITPIIFRPPHVPHVRRAGNPQQAGTSYAPGLCILLSTTYCVYP